MIGDDCNARQVLLQIIMEQESQGGQGVLSVDLMMDMESAFGFQYEALTLPSNPSLEEIAGAIVANSALAR